MDVYRVYGLAVRSSLALPAPPGSTGGPVDVTFLSRDALSSLPAGATRLRPRPAAGEPDAAASLWLLPDGGRRIDYADGCSFVIDGDAATVLVRQGPSASAADVLTYLLGPVAGHLLRLRGVPCLHAGAAVVDDRAVVWTGRSGAGKSTLAAAFALAGHQVIADDVVPVIAGDPPMVLGGHGWVKLWPDSTERLLGASDALPQVAPPWPKQVLEIDATPERVPIDAIYHLPAAEEAGSPHVEPLTDGAALLALLRSSYAGPVLTTAQREEELALFGELVREVPCRRLAGAIRDVAPARLCEMVVADVRSSTAPPCVDART